MPGGNVRARFGTSVARPVALETLAAVAEICVVPAAVPVIRALALVPARFVFAILALVRVRQGRERDHRAKYRRYGKPLFHE
jgi:hypothetical protein